MPICEKCGKEHTGPAGCPDCDGSPAMYGPEHDLHLVSVYRAEDEMTAHLIQGALVNNGVPAHIHSEQASMFGAILRTDHGCWGEVMVPEAYTERALDIVEVFTTQPIVDEDEDTAPEGEHSSPSIESAAVSASPTLEGSSYQTSDRSTQPPDLPQTVQPAAPTADLQDTVPLDPGEEGPDLVPLSTQPPGPERPVNDPPA